MIMGILSLFFRIQNSVVPLCKGWEKIMIKSCWIERVDPMRTYLICPTCGSDDIVKNGLTRRAKQSHKCRDCGRQFVEDPQWQPIDRSVHHWSDWLDIARTNSIGRDRTGSITFREQLTTVCESALWTGPSTSWCHSKRTWKADGLDGWILVICR